MTNTRGEVHRWWLVPLGVAAGCLGASAPPDHFYRLATGAPEHRLAEPLFHGTLAVERFRAGGLLGERALLFTTQEAPLEVHRHGYHYWTESPTILLHEQLVTFLRHANVADAVVSGQGRAVPDWVVSGHIDRLERVLAKGASRVLIELRLELARGPRETRPLHAGVYRVERTVENDDVPSAVDALNQAVGEIYGRFLADITARGACAAGAQDESASGSKTTRWASS